MDNTLDNSPYLQWYVLVDPGHLSVQSASITGKAILWFVPKYGQDCGNSLCIAGGTTDELLELKGKVEKRKAEYQTTDKYQRYLQIEKWFKDGEGQIDPLKPHMSEYQKDRLAKKRKERRHD